MKPQNTYWINDSFDFLASENKLVRNGKEESVEKMIAELSLFLIENANRPVTHEELVQKFWGPTVKSNEAMMKAVSKARKVFGSNSIRTIPKVGYQWVAKTERVQERSQSGRMISLFRNYSNKDLLVRGFLLLAFMMVIKGIFFPHEH